MDENEKSNAEKPSILIWAEKEIDRLLEFEKIDTKDDESAFEYYSECYKSALRAYESLVFDGHSNNSIALTKHVLNRLIDLKPLTSIEDTDDVWSIVSNEKDPILYQCNRLSSLFKYVWKNGTIKYSDIDSVICIDADNPNNTYHSGFIQNLIDDMFPIKMPYYPEEKIKVIVKDFLFDKKNGDFDTIGCLYAIKGDGERITINKFFKESADTKGLTEITFEEYSKRLEKRIIKENKNKIKEEEKTV